MPSVSFVDQVTFNVTQICQLFASCKQHYALHCSSDGHFAQLIFGADLVRVHRRSSADDSPAAVLELLTNHLVSFETRTGTYVKTLAFFLRDLLTDRALANMQTVERRLFLLKIHEQLSALTYPSTEHAVVRREDLDIEQCTGHILDTLPRDVFDRQGTYHRLLSQLIRRKGCCRVKCQSNSFLRR